MLACCAVLHHIYVAHGDERTGGKGSSCILLRKAVTWEATFKLCTQYMLYDPALAMLPSPLMSDVPGFAGSFSQSVIQLSCALVLLQRLWEEGGIARFYKGFTPCLLRAVPANGIMLLTVDKVTAYLNR